MSWVDLLAAGIIIGIAFAESKRGFGLALFDLVGALLAMKISLALAPVLAKSAPLGFQGEDGTAFWLMALFVVLGALVLLGSKMIYQTTLLSLDVMDPTVGAILGIGTGLMAAHIVLRTMLFAAGSTPFGEHLAETIAVRQLVELHGYHYVFQALSHIGDTTPSPPQ